MKKLILSIVALITVTHIVNAQDTTHFANRKIGFKLGANIATYKGKGDYNIGYENFVGFHFSTFYSFKINKNLLIEPALTLQSKGFNYKSAQQITRTVSNINPPFATTKFSYFEEIHIRHRIISLDIPLNIIYQTLQSKDGALNVNVGPFIGINLSGTQFAKDELNSQPIFTGKGGERDLKFGESTDDDLKKYDLGMNAGLKYRMSNGFGFGFNYVLGMQNMSNSLISENSIKNRSFTIAVQYSL